MICPSCRAHNLEGADYCANCGHDLAGADLPAVTADRAFVYEPVSALSSSPPVYVAPNDPVFLAVRRMQVENAPCVLVMDGERLAGILTPWDLLQKVAGQRDDLNAVTCREVMTPDPVCMDSDHEIAVALNKMSVGGFRHLPVVKHDRPVAVISIADVFHHISPHLV